jgi:hypothetical protein
MDRERNLKVSSGLRQEGPFCPSAQPFQKNSIIFATIDNSSGAPEVSYLESPVEVTGATSVMMESIHRPTRLFRFAAPCERLGCANWSGNNCRVAERLVQILPAVTDSLPACVLRLECRWFEQEGVPACLRCPMVMTDNVEFEAALNGVSDRRGPDQRDKS